MITIIRRRGECDPIDVITMSAMLPMLFFKVLEKDGKSYMTAQAGNCRFIKRDQ